MISTFKPPARDDGGEGIYWAYGKVVTSISFISLLFDSAGDRTQNLSTKDMASISDYFSG